MKATILSICFILLSVPVLSQDSIPGYYTYQTGATERIGQILDLKPNRSFTLSSIRYGWITPIDSGWWHASDDTVFFNSKDSTFYLESISEFHLKTFLNDSIDPTSFEACLYPTHWTKTRSYHKNGQIKSTISWESISWYCHEFILDGIWVSYYENGCLKEIGKYRNGKKRGKWYYLTPNGTERK